MKPSLVLAMLLLLALGVWLVARPSKYQTHPGSQVHTVSLGRDRGILEVWPAAGPAAGSRFRIHTRDGHVSPELADEEIIRILGAPLHAELTTAHSNWLFTFLRITSWGSLAWIVLGFAGQMAFFGRMLVQWVVSERRGKSVVPSAFWWLSLFGGAALFAYFVWRQDLIGVIGQTSGIVIYARNIRLISKEKKARAEDEATAEAL